MRSAENVAEQSRAIRARMHGEGAKPWEIAGELYHHHWHASLACKEASPELAIAHLREVEAAQRIVASGATSGGEGRMYMNDLYRIMAERARLHERLAATSTEHAVQAIEVWGKIVADPNGVGKWAEPEPVRARARLGFDNGNNG